MFSKKRAAPSSVSIPINSGEGAHKKRRDSITTPFLVCVVFILLVWVTVSLVFFKSALVPSKSTLTVTETPKHPVQRTSHKLYNRVIIEPDTTTTATNNNNNENENDNNNNDEEDIEEVPRHLHLINDKTTFIIKTMDRPASCFKLLKSIYAMWPHARVIVGDDGDTPIGAELSQKAGSWGETVPARYIRMEADAGLSATRNALVKATETEYFVLLDDDFEFDGDRANITRLVQVLDEVPGLSIVLGGLHMPPKKNRGKNRVTKKDGDDYFYAGLIRIDQDDEEGPTMRLVEETYGPVPGFEKVCSYVDIGINFFAARQADVAAVLWDPQLKLAEHEDFFLRMKEAGKKVASCKDVSILHDKDPGDKVYKEKRTRGKELWKVALSKHGINKLVLFNGYTVYANK